MRVKKVGFAAALTALAGGCAAVPPPATRAAPAPAPASVTPPTPAPIATPVVPIDRSFHFDSDEFIQGGLVRGEAPDTTQRLTFDGKPIEVAPDGRFLIAFDRDHGDTATLVATLADGSTVSDTLHIAKREWRIERLNRLRKVSQPSAEFQRRRPGELEQIHAARAEHTDAAGWRQKFIWPVRGRISGLFGSQRFYRGEPGAYHSGTDIAVPTGTPIVAPADGVVTMISRAPFTLEGKLLFIDHGMGLNSVFIHLSGIDVEPGEHVKQGQKIAESGATGRATGPHLHWGLVWNGARIDPLLVAGPMGSR
ncbi:MAG: peptidase [Sphingomonas sp.]|nr:peptidase [Sphingomonas sp.]